MTRSLEAELVRIRADSHPQRRGRALEQLLVDLLRLNHFTVERNPGTARPRQTDVIASDDERTFVVEAKSTAAPSDVADIDDLYGRLQAAPAGLVGVLVSLSGFRRTAIERAETRRDHPILLVTGQELDDALEAPTLRRLLNEKYEALLCSGRSLIVSRPDRAVVPGVRAPRSAIERYFLQADGSQLRWLKSSGGYPPLTFALRLEDIDWTSASGRGVSLDLAIPTLGTSGVQGVLERLSAAGWTTEHGQWAIHQSTASWHGFAAGSLHDALDSWRSRYAGLDLYHHTEQVAYYDRCDGGFYTLMADVAAREDRAAWRVDVSFQLTGVPIDTRPFRQLARSLNVDRPAYFRPRSEESVSTGHLHREEWLPVKALALVVDVDPWPVESHEEWVSGIVVRNPFYKTKSTPNWWPQALDDSELLVCSLGSWHQLAGGSRNYFLKRFNWARSSDVIAFCATADWANPDPSTASSGITRQPARAR